ncbi:MAG: RNase H family protein [Mediterraneibacter gnavus]
MKEVNIYIRTSLTGPCIKDGRWAAAMECQTSKGPAVKGICGEEQETTYYRLVLLGIVKSLKILNAPCHVTLYTDCIFIKNMIENGKPEQWKRAEWRKPSGEEVKNLELWQQYQDAGRTA